MKLSVVLVGFVADAVPLPLETSEQLGLEELDVASSSAGSQVVGGVFLVPGAQRVHANFDVVVSHLWSR